MLTFNRGTTSIPDGSKLLPSVRFDTVFSPIGGGAGSWDISHSGYAGFWRETATACPEATVLNGSLTSISRIGVAIPDPEESYVPQQAVLYFERYGLNLLGLGLPGSQIYGVSCLTLGGLDVNVNVNGSGGEQPIAITTASGATYYSGTVIAKPRYGDIAAVYGGLQIMAEGSAPLLLMTGDGLNTGVDGIYTRLSITANATSAAATWSNMTSIAYGAIWQDITGIATPAAPAAGTRRLYVNTATGFLSVETSAGLVVSLENTAAVTPGGLAGQAQWNDAATFNGSAGLTLSATAILSATSTAAFTWAHSGGAFALNSTSQSLTLSTVTSGTLALVSAGALNLTGVAASTLSFSGGALIMQTTSQNFTVRTVTSGALNITSAATMTLTATSNNLLIRTTTSGSITLTSAADLVLTGAAGSGVRVNSTMRLNGAASSFIGVYSDSETILTGSTSQYGVFTAAVYDSGCTVAAYGYRALIRTQAAAYAIPSAYLFYAADAILQAAGDSITTQYGFYAETLVGGGTNWALSIGNNVQLRAALSFIGASAFTWTHSGGAWALNSTSQSLTLSTITSGTLALVSAGALNFTSVAASTWTHSGGAFAINSTSQNVTIATVTSGTLALTSAGAYNETAAAASTFVNAANTALAWRITDGTANYYVLDTRTGITGVGAHTFSTAAPSFASATGNTFSLLKTSAFTITQTGTTTITALAGLMHLGGSPTVTNSSAGLTITTVSAWQFGGPLPAGNATFTNSIAVDIPTYATNGTTASGLRVAAPTGAATFANHCITLSSSATNQGYGVNYVVGSGSNSGYGFVISGSGADDLSIGNAKNSKSGGRDYGIYSSATTSALGVGFHIRDETASTNIISSTLGNTITLHYNTTITGNLLFTDNTYDIGASNATRPRRLYLAGFLELGGAGSTNNQFSTASTGAGSTPMYIGNGLITVVSDARLKTDIKPTTLHALEAMQKLTIIDHAWDDPSDKNPYGRNARGRWTGLTAQELIGVFPWLVNHPTHWCADCQAGKCAEHDSYVWQADFAYFAPVFVKGFQEVATWQETADQKIARLEARVAELEKRAA